MTEDTHRTWDIVFKWFGLFAVLASAAWTVKTYRDGRALELQQQYETHIKDEEARTKDQNSFIFQRQAALYFDAAQAAATLAASTDAKRLKDAHERFEELFYGELVMVEDHRIEAAMVTFQNCLDKNGMNCGRQDVNLNDSRVKSYVERYPAVPRNLSLELASCVRTALQDDREIRFGTLKPGTTVCPYE
jgi:hypothetical protein